MDIEVTQKTSKTARQYKLTPEQMAFADLIAVGWEPEDAWAVAIRQGITWTKTMRKETIANLKNSTAVNERIQDVRAVLRKSQIEAVKNTKKSEQQSLVSQATSKETMLIDLQEAKLSMTRGSKEWLEINKLIVDVTRMKRDEVKDEETTIHHYLPVDYPTSCEYCLIGMKKKKTSL